MKFVTFTAIIDRTRTPVKINPAHVVGIASPMGANGPMLDRCEVLVSGGMFHVVGTVDEVSAALESATAPPVAAAVEVAPTDLEMAAQVLEVVASEIEDDELEHLAARVNNKLGTRYDVTRFDGAISRLVALAAKLRGGG